MRDRFVQAPLLVRSYKCIWHFELGNHPETSTKKKKTGIRQKVARISHMVRSDLRESLQPRGEWSYSKTGVPLLS